MTDSLPLQTTDWSSIPVSARPGRSGVATYRTAEFGDFRVRLVEYSANYRADHWCSAGHIAFCLEGEMTCVLMDGRSFKLSQGMSYVVSDDMSMHRSSTEKGVRLMIVDGQFLNFRKQRERNPWKM